MTLSLITGCGYGPTVDGGQRAASDGSQTQQACLGADGCDGVVYTDVSGQTVCDAPRRNNCGICGADPVPGIGAPCNDPGGRSGVAVCGLDGATTCASTVVSLTVDDTFDDASTARDAFESHGIRSTFFVNSPRFARGPGFMTLDQVRDLQHRGHEIGGHTLDHTNLPMMTDAQARVEICHDRAELLSLGLDVKSFAYPFGANTSATQQAVRDCNYNSARQIGGVSDGSPAYADGFVPKNPFAIRTPSSVGMDTTLDELEGYVTHAESVGGWIVINMHHVVCDTCPVLDTKRSTTMTAGTLNAFLDWLTPRSAQGTVEQTIRQMVWGETRPAVDWSLGPDSNGNWLQDPSLEDVVATTGLPECWEHVGSGTNTSHWTNGVPHSGAVAATITMDTYASGARGLMSKHDYGGCTPLLTPGRSYEVSAWYVAPDNTPVFEIDYFYRGAWLTWLFSSRFPPSQTYTQAVWVTPPLPAEVQQVSVGMMMKSVGSLTVDDLDLRAVNP
jgi:peptidoglycan/xylan/chitin deacetylase (PgdA/CDA1 family)